MSHPEVTAIDRARGSAWALVPAKCFEHGKSRLSGQFAPEARVRFARTLFAHVVSTAVRCPALDGVAVATDCACVSEAARALGALVFDDGAAQSLAGVVDAALTRLAARGADQALVLMSDLPLVEARDLHRLVRMLRRVDMVVVPDGQSYGTNALAVRLAGRPSTCFGTGDSFARHCAAAARAGLRLRVHKSARVGFDVDGPEDLARLGTG
jgi:2-phospho-L-lactate guanylyltransferase